MDVDEVSLVDEPANLTQFLVLKALETEQMADPKTSAADASATSVEVDQTVEAAESDSSVTKALAHVESIVKNITEAVAPEPAPEAAPAATTESAEVEKAEEVETEKGMTIEAAMKASGLTGEPLEKAIVNMEKATGLQRTQPFNSKPPLAKTKKAAEPESQPAVVAEEDAPLTIGGLAEAIEKAKAFTPGRIEQLKKAEEILKLILQGVAPGTSPATSTPGVAMHPNPNTSATLTKPSPQASVRKSAEDGAVNENEFAEVLKGLGELIKGFDDRLEKVEKARPASNSLPQETESQTPVQKSIWAGVL